MRAVSFRAMRAVRAHRWSTLTAVAAICLLVGTTSTLVAGARRTASVPTRYAASLGDLPDARVTEFSGGRADRSRADELASLPGVTTVSFVSFVFGELRPVAAAGSEPPGASGAQVFSGELAAIGMNVVEGRDLDQDASDEMVASTAFMEASGASIGDEFDVVTLTPAEAQQGFDSPTATGPRWHVRLVGVFDGPALMDDPSPLVVLPGSLLDDERVAIAVSIDAVTLDPTSDLASFAAQVTSLPGGESLSVDPFVVMSEDVANAIGTRADGAWLLALLAGLVSLVVLTQLLVRQVRLTPLERQQLRALGYTDTQLLAESVGRAAVPIVLGSILSTVVAVVLSGRFPTGFVRRFEPDLGRRFDVLVLGPGTVAAIVVLLATTTLTLAATRGGRRVRPPAPAVEWFAQRVPVATLVTGLRFAFARPARDRTTVRGSVAGLALAVTALVTAVVFAGALDRLVAMRFYDAQFDNGSMVLADGLLDTLAQDADVAALSRYMDGQLAIGDDLVTVVGYARERGDLTPPVLEGRLPVGDGEIAFGRLTADELGLGVDDVVDVGGQAGSAELQVTGIVAVPNVGSNNGVGRGGVLTIGELERLAGAGTSTTTPVVRLRPMSAADRAVAIARLSDETGVQGADATMPPSLRNSSRVRSVPAVLAWMLAALVALTAAHATATTVRDRRRDLAVLRALGAERPWTTRTVHWLATALTAVPVVIGVPCGIVAGRLLFAAYADGLGAPRTTPLSALRIAGIAVGVLLLANLASVLTDRRHRRIAPAVVLRSE